MDSVYSGEYLLDVGDCRANITGNLIVFPAHFLLPQRTLEASMTWLTLPQRMLSPFITSLPERLVLPQRMLSPFITSLPERLVLPQRMLLLCNDELLPHKMLLPATDELPQRIEFPHKMELPHRIEFPARTEDPLATRRMLPFSACCAIGERALPTV